MRYGFGILKWTTAELKQIDRKTRKIFTKYKFHHPKSNLHRLYLHRKLGGRGIISAEDCHRQECWALAEHINTNEDPITKIVLESESTKKLGILRYLNNEKKGNSVKINEEHYKSLKEMNLHGQYFKEQENITDVNLELSWQWLKQSHLTFETESLVFST